MNKVWPTVDDYPSRKVEITALDPALISVANKDGVSVLQERRPGRDVLSKRRLILLEAEVDDHAVPISNFVKLAWLAEWDGVIDDLGHECPVVLSDDGGREDSVGRDPSRESAE